MKLFGFEIRKFEQNNTTIQVIETWCVKWSSLRRLYLLDRFEAKINVQGFPTKAGADAYAKELTDARNLLGDGGLDVEVYKQRIPTNAK